MRHDRDDIDRTVTGAGLERTAAGSAQGLERLGDLDDYEVADEDPDIRGWDVRTADGGRVGKVDDLIVDRSAMRVRYLEVELDRKELALSEDRHVLVPIGTARLDDDNDNVLVPESTTELLAAPAYDRSRLTADYERSLEGWYATRGAKAGGGAKAGADASHLYDDREFWGGRRAGRENAAYLTRSEEELAIGKQKVQAGEVDVQKRVETEHVRKEVPVRREEVTVERRPVSPGMRSEPRIGKDEVRIPVSEEQVVVEKRTVPKEEVVVKKHTTTEKQTIEADLEKERIDVDRKGDIDRERRP